MTEMHRVPATAALDFTNGAAFCDGTYVPAGWPGRR